MLVIGIRDSRRIKYHFGILAPVFQGFKVQKYEKQTMLVTGIRDSRRIQYDFGILATLDWFVGTFCFAFD